MDNKVTLDLRASAQLSLEGIRNELVRAINSLRKKAELKVEEYVDISIETDGFAIFAIENYKQYLTKNCLLKEIEVLASKSKDTVITIGSETLTIPFKKMHSSVGISDGNIVYGKDTFPTYWHGLKEFIRK